MSAKRSNNAVWKLVVPDDVTPKGRLTQIIDTYAEQAAEDSGHRPLKAIPLDQALPDIHLDLYVRRNFSRGLLPFVQEYLAKPNDHRRNFHIHSADVCLFLATSSSLFAITSGNAHHIIAEFVDYSFPFDTAKKLISNNFSAADVRDMTGSKSSRSETYRRTYSIDKSEAMDTVWKKLVGRLEAERLPEDSLLRDIINQEKPPAVEIKSAFVLRQKLDLAEVAKLIQDLEVLPEPSQEHLRELSFLDNLYPIKNDKQFTDDLTRQLVENIRQAMLADKLPDIDVLDPYDILSFKAGANFSLSRFSMGDIAPDIDAILPILHTKLQQHLSEKAVFFEEFSKLSLSYHIDPDETSKTIRRKLIDFLHGQVDLHGRTYFRVDKVWYRCLGEFLENLKKDFIDEVFISDKPVLLTSSLTFLPWTGGSERKFNESQAQEPGFYFGDEIFAKTGKGRVELFDLIKVDDAEEKLYIIHVKKDFAAKMRDACSQILLSADVIFRDLANAKPVLIKYFDEEWSKEYLNRGIDREKFLSWFDYELNFVVLCSTTKQFVADDFTEGRLTSHIARREILATKNEMKRNGRNFHLAHTKYGR